METKIPNRKYIWKQQLAFSGVKKQSFFLFGPRGTGKFTWVHKNLKNALFIDLLAPEVFRAYSAKPERLCEVSEAYKSGGTIVIDEIQKTTKAVEDKISNCLLINYLIHNSSFSNIFFRTTNSGICVRLHAQFQSLF